MRIVEIDGHREHIVNVFNSCIENNCVNINLPAKENYIFEGTSFVHPLFEGFIIRRVIIIYRHVFLEYKFTHIA